VLDIAIERQLGYGMVTSNEMALMEANRKRLYDKLYALRTDPFTNAS
jgi:hypothetical protein